MTDPTPPSNAGDDEDPREQRRRLEAELYGVDPMQWAEEDWAEAIEAYKRRDPGPLQRLFARMEGLPPDARMFLDALAADEVERPIGRPALRTPEEEREILFDVYKQWAIEEKLPTKSRGESPEHRAYDAVAKRRNLSRKTVEKIVEKVRKDWPREQWPFCAMPLHWLLAAARGPETGRIGGPQPNWQELIERLQPPDD